MTLVMLDTIDLPQLVGFGVKPDALAGYVNGFWPTYSELHKYAPPGAHLLSISVNASGNAECLDVEPGDAAINQASGWVKRALGRGIARPCIYTSASSVDSLVASLESAGVARKHVRLWSAHYAGKHICGPHTCRETAYVCDGTQWTKNAGGRNLDQSELADSFFGDAPAGHGSLLLDEVTSVFFLDQGPNVATPISIPNGANHVRFASNDKAELHIDLMTHGTDIDIALSYASTPHVIAIPAGCHQVVAHRVDGGVNRVSASFYA